MSNVCNVPVCVATVDVPPARPSLPSPWVDTHMSMTPPFLQVLVPHGVSFGGVCHGADAAPELGVDEVSGSLPSEVRVVARVVCVELSQVGGQLSRRRELVDVDVRVWWRHLEVVLGRRAHHNRHDIVATTQSDVMIVVEKVSVTGTHVHTHARPHAHTPARRPLRTRAHMHAYTHARTHTHTRHARRHTSIFICSTHFVE